MTAQGDQRLFFALWPPQGVCAAIEQALPEGLPGRRIPSRNWHITLRFLGEIPAERAGHIRATVAGLHFPSFTLRLDHWGYWRGPQIFWCGSQVTPPALLQLAAALEECARSCGLSAEMRPFQVHLSIARKVQRRPVFASQLGPIDWPVDTFCLVESALSSQGSTYTIVEQWALSG